MCKYAVFEPHAQTPEVWRCCMNESTLHSIAHGTAVQIPSNWLHLKLIQSLNSMDYILLHCSYTCSYSTSGEGGAMA